MFTPIILKNSTTASSVPTAADLQVGEVAVNTADGKLFTKHSDGTIKTISGTPSGGTTVVVAAFTMPSSVAAGGALVLTLSGTAALVGGSIASFELTGWNSAVTTAVAASGTGSKTLTASMTVGQVLSVSVVAIDNYGNRSLPIVHTSTVVPALINAVTITSPANAATGITETPTISGDSFGVTNGTDTQVSADWEIWTGANRTGTLAWSSINNTVNKTSITVPAATLVANTTYYIAARYKGTTYGYGGYGYCSFTTATSFVPTVMGAAYQGGFFAGKIVVGGSTYALVVAPKASGENTSGSWKLTNTDTPGTLSLNNGLSNSDAMNNDSHPAAQFCRGLAIGGHSDWYLPSRDELEICYRNFKPLATVNTVYAVRTSFLGAGNGSDSQGNGDNDNSEPPGSAYTTSVPAQTAAPAFSASYTEAFAANYYWASTEFNGMYAWSQTFLNGSQYLNFKANSIYARAVRKVLI